MKFVKGITSCKLQRSKFFHPHTPSPRSRYYSEELQDGWHETCPPTCCNVFVLSRTEHNNVVWLFPPRSCSMRETNFVICWIRHQRHLKATSSVVSKQPFLIACKQIGEELYEERLVFQIFNLTRAVLLLSLISTCNAFQCVKQLL